MQRFFKANLYYSCPEEAPSTRGPKLFLAKWNPAGPGLDFETRGARRALHLLLLLSRCHPDPEQAKRAEGERTSRFAGISTTLQQKRKLRHPERSIRISSRRIWRDEVIQKRVEWTCGCFVSGSVFVLLP
jgi:hypothetical protein